MYIDNLIGNGENDGLFYTSHDSKNIIFKAKNVTLDNLYQKNQFDSSLIYIERNNNVTMNRYN